MDPGILFNTIIPAASYYRRLLDFEKNTVRACYCGGCHNAWPQNVNGAVLVQTGYGLEVPQIKCHGYSGKQVFYDRDLTYATDPIPDPDPDNIRAIRDYLKTHFTYAELRRLMDDNHKDDARKVMSSGTTVDEKIDNIIDFVRTRLSYPQLVNGIRAFRHHSVLAGRTVDLVCVDCGCPRPKTYVSTTGTIVFQTDTAEQTTEESSCTECHSQTYKIVQKDGSVPEANPADFDPPDPNDPNPDIPSSVRRFIK